MSARPRKVPRPNGIPTMVTSAITDTMGSPKNRPTPQPIDAPIRSTAATAMVSAARGANRRSNSPRTRIETETATHTANRLIQLNRPKITSVFTRRRSPSIAAPDATLSVDWVTRSPPIRAPEATVTSPLNEVTSPVTVPEIDTSPLKEVTEPRTVPSMVAGPLKITTSPTVWLAWTTTCPVNTIWGSFFSESAAKAGAARASRESAANGTTTHSISRRRVAIISPPSSWSRQPLVPQPFPPNESGNDRTQEEKEVVHDWQAAERQERETVRGAEEEGDVE